MNAIQFHRAWVPACGALCLTLSLSLSASAPQDTPAEPPLLVVAALGRGGVPQAACDGLQHILVHELAQAERYEVVGVDEIDAMLQLERARDLLGCDEVTCAAQLGGALGARFVATGLVSRLADTVWISLKLVDIEEGRVIERVCVETAWEPHRLPDAMRHAARQLLGDSPSQPLPAPAPAPAAASRGEPLDAWSERLRRLLAVEIECRVLRDCIALARAQIAALEQFERETDWSRHTRREREILRRRLAELRRGLEALETTELKTGPAGPFDIRREGNELERRARTLGGGP